MLPQTPPESPEVLADLGQIVQQRVQDWLPPRLAAELAQEVVEAVRQRWGGSLIYIPKGAAWARQQRDAAIAAAFTGHNHGELARRYHLTVTQIYAILQRQRQSRQDPLNF